MLWRMGSTCCCVSFSPRLVSRHGCLNRKRFLALELCRHKVWLWIYTRNEGVRVMKVFFKLWNRILDRGDLSTRKKVRTEIIVLYTFFMCKFRVLKMEAVGENCHTAHNLFATYMYRISCSAPSTYWWHDWKWLKGQSCRAAVTQVLIKAQVPSPFSSAPPPHTHTTLIIIILIHPRIWHPLFHLLLPRHC